LISKLLTKDKTQRLGKTDGVKEIISHPWFSSIDVEKLLKKQI